MQTSCCGLKDEIEENDFFVKQISTSCLAQFSYYLESNKEAIIIDPMREPVIYLKMLNERSSRLKFIFETHFHADFVSGHLELAELTGAKIVYGPNASPEFEFISAKDEEIFKFGNANLKVLHTPGHTLESCCFLLLESNLVEKAIFTGDTLFLGEVGRPDLASKTISEVDLASMLYDSVHIKLKPLPDHIIVFPGHGAGSPCGKKISSGGSDTLKNQKKTNYVFNENLSRQEFIEILTTNLCAPPKYFFHDVMLNKRGPNFISTLLEKCLKELTYNEFIEELKKENLIAIDTREVDIVCKGFIPGSVSITLTTNYASWVGTLFSLEQKYLIICEKGKETESIIRLARIGYENIIGYFYFENWIANESNIESVENIDITNIIKNLIENDNEFENNNRLVIDVREKGEWENTGIIPNSVTCALSQIHFSDLEVLKNKELYLLCRSGQRTLIYASILKKNGFKNKMTNLRGGISKILNNSHIKLNNYKLA
jgi:glyoxylase-like metal-dependent hydrolase (beta-lactamase superfamily II)/rhodanese-related sulfurtransferase